MDGERRTVPFAALIQRALWTVVAPQRVFRRLSDAEDAPVFQMGVIVAVLGFSESMFRSYFFFRGWIFQLFPSDWLLFSLGCTCFGFNAWLLGVVTLRILNRWSAIGARHPAVYWLASFYVFVAFWVVSVAGDLVHLILQWPPHEVHLGWRWLSGPLVALWTHAALWVELPWLIGVSWVMYRQVLGWRAPARAITAAALAVGLPLAGRFLLEPLPNLLALLLTSWGWAPTRGWVVVGSHGTGWVLLVAYGFVTCVTAFFLWWWRSEACGCQLVKKERGNG